MLRKLAVVTCQPDPDYVRARTLRAGLAAISDIKVLVLKNRYRGVLRYLEIAWKLVVIRWKHNPDIYLLTFRGYEILPWLLLLARGKKVIFDEFINPIEWVAYEHKLLSPHGFVCRVLSSFYSFLLKHCDAIVTDTKSHAKLSACLSNIPESKYFTIHVGTDESIFAPATRIAPENSNVFRVFFYGNILPLHGLDVILDAALQLRSYADIEFLLIGGRAPHASQVEQAVRSGARIIYKQFVPFEELASHIHRASICLAGPFGNTLQARHVITGKAFQFLACASPTIVGDNLASSVFSDKRNALIVPQSDSNALSDAILWGYMHRDLLVEIGKSGKRLYEDLFSTKSISAGISRLLIHLDETVPLHAKVQ
ncbi:MAG: glycosyltransferase [Rhodoferax sp.]